MEEIKNNTPNEFDILLNQKKSKDSIKKLIYKKGNTKLVIEVNPRPSVAERISKINHVVGLLFSDKDGGDYMPQFYDFALRYGVVSTFTRLILPADIDVVEAILFDASLFKDIVKAIGKRALADFERDFNNLIEYKKQVLIGQRVWSEVVKKAIDYINEGWEQYKNLDFTKVFEVFKKNFPSGSNLEDFIK